MSVRFAGSCPVCGSECFNYQPVLWAELISSWQLTDEEVAYIDRQQGLSCAECLNNLRSLALAKAILMAHGYNGTLKQYCSMSPGPRVIEINRAGNLTAYLSKMPSHRLVEYPDHDMMSLNIGSDEFDLVIHSDTLEHVPYPEKGLSECRRILREGGLCIFTVPIVIGRMTRSRAGLPLSYHGGPGISALDQIVCTEFGADVWQFALRAGFASVEIVCLEYPSGLAIVARK